MNPFLEVYAQCYDAIHDGKDYASEVKAIVALLEKNGVTPKNLRVLDFGAGTGMHAKHFKSIGIAIEAYEPSVFMANQAAINCDSLVVYAELKEIYPNFDLVLSLFDILSYQTTPYELNKYLREMRNVLVPEGYILLDSWHTPGVLLDPPNIREKEFQIRDSSWLRKVTPVQTDLIDTFDLKIELLELPERNVRYSMIHKMKSYSMGEIMQALHLNGFEIINFGNANGLDGELQDDSWRFWILAIKN